MTADTRKTITVHRPESGWATARRKHGQGLRTGLRAKADVDTEQRNRGHEWNVVRSGD
ncbi:hypothetical protein [Streptomyces sp. NPDC059010]|uniref:hypothetical protein n=1 Tax=Streptomyces sp. NPDC059010 TaxID=3346695 RepID=UPI00369C0DCF